MNIMLGMNTVNDLYVSAQGPAVTADEMPFV